MPVLLGAGACRAAAPPHARRCVASVHAPLHAPRRPTRSTPPRAKAPGQCRMAPHTSHARHGARVLCAWRASLAPPALEARGSAHTTLAMAGRRRPRPRPLPRRRGARRGPGAFAPHAHAERAHRAGRRLHRAKEECEHHAASLVTKIDWPTNSTSVLSTLSHSF